MNANVTSFMQGFQELSILGLRGRQLYRTAVINQRRWIEWCEQNGKSYSDGERGERIRQADLAELRRLESLAK